jgi:hypothetical protein
VQVAAQVAPAVSAVDVTVKVAAAASVPNQANSISARIGNSPSGR